MVIAPKAKHCCKWISKHDEADSSGDSSMEFNDKCCLFFCKASAKRQIPQRFDEFEQLFNIPSVIIYAFNCCNGMFLVVYQIGFSKNSLSF